MLELDELIIRAFIGLAQACLNLAWRLLANATARFIACIAWLCFLAHSRHVRQGPALPPHLQQRRRQINHQLQAATDAQRANNLRGALAHYDEAITLVTAGAQQQWREPALEGHCGRAQVHITLRQYLDAVADCCCALELDPFHVTALRLRANVYLTLRMDAAANQVSVCVCNLPLPRPCACVGGGA